MRCCAHKQASTSQDIGHGPALGMTAMAAELVWACWWWMAITVDGGLWWLFICMWLFASWCVPLVLAANIISCGHIVALGTYPTQEQVRMENQQMQQQMQQMQQMQQ